MSGMNSSQDPDYVGPVGFERKFHQTHFQGAMERPTHPKDDPDWEYIGVGRWRKKRIDAAERSAEVHNGEKEDIQG